MKPQFVTSLITVVIVLACTHLIYTGKISAKEGGLTYAEEMYLGGIRNGCVVSQMKVMPEEAISVEKAVKVDYGYCEKLYQTWKAMILKREGKL